MSVMVWWLRSVSIAAALMLTAVVLRRWLLTVVAAIGALVVAIGVLVASAYVAGQWRRARAVRLFRAVWGTRGKDVLLVYSNSPHWQRHVEENWLPRWGHRAVLLNWSDRRKWDRSQRAEVALFRAFSGAREFNPLAIVVPATGRHAHVIRFWRAFRERKHGKPRLLAAAETELDHRLSVAPDGLQHPPTSSAR